MNKYKATYIYYPLGDQANCSDIQKWEFEADNDEQAVNVVREWRGKSYCEDRHRISLIKVYEKGVYVYACVKLG